TAAGGGAGRTRRGGGAARGPAIRSGPRRALEHLRGRIEDDFAAVAVDDDHLPGLNLLARIVEADDRRHFERSREDRRVIRAAARVGGEAAHFGPRSEEHTSELQSRFDLVCRLLLEKKKKNN